MAERERLPRPEREHAIGQAIFALSRMGWGVYYARCIATTPSAERKATEKAALLEQIDALRAQVDAL